VRPISVKPVEETKRDTFESGDCSKARARRSSSNGSRLLVPAEGLEPPLPFENQILSLARLPFRHAGLMINQLRIQIRPISPLDTGVVFSDQNHTEMQAEYPHKKAVRKLIFSKPLESGKYRVATSYS
jgi:hypothetical protein